MPGGYGVSSEVVMRPSSSSIAHPLGLAVRDAAKASLGFIAGCRSDRYISVVRRAMSPFAYISWIAWHRSRRPMRS